MFRILRNILFLFTLMLILMLGFLAIQRRIEPEYWIAFEINDQNQNTFALMIVPMDGSTARRITDTGGLFSAASGDYDWSPNGTVIIRENLELGISSSTIIPIRHTRIIPPKPPATHYYVQPDWSPDGAWILFASNLARNVAFDIFKIRPDGTALQRLSYDAELRYARLPQWSPDGNWVAFTCFYPSNQFWRLCRMRGDGSDLAPIAQSTQGRSFLWNMYQWSPDSRWIAMLWENTSAQIISADGATVITLPITTRLDNPAALPSWSPDSHAFTLAGFHDTQGGGIWRVNVDGTAMTRLTHDRTDSYPIWSPDGEWIVYSHAITHDQVQLYKMRPDGSAQQPLSSTTYSFIGNMQFSPRYGVAVHLRELGLLAGGLILGIGLFTAKRHNPT